MTNPTPPTCRLPPLRIEAVFKSLSETVDWSLAAYNIPQQWKQTSGQGIRVAVLDTGVDLGHPDLAGAIDEAVDFTQSRFGPADRQGHGTHVAGTIAARRNGQGVIGVAPECRLLITKVLDDSGAGDPQNVAAGIDWAADSGANILSLSLGSPDPSPQMAAAIGRAVAKGCFVICAAGNDGRPDSVNYPARRDNTLAIGAVDRNGRVSPFSSRGPQVDLSAPGQDIVSTYLGGGYAKLSGTSMATPFASGVVALLLSKHRDHTGETPVEHRQQLIEHLRRTATDAGPVGRDPDYGYGLINPDSVLEDLPNGPPPPTSPGLWVFIPNGQTRETIICQ